MLVTATEGFDQDGVNGIKKYVLLFFFFVLFPVSSPSTIVLFSSSVTQGKKSRNTVWRALIPLGEQ